MQLYPQNYTARCSRTDIAKFHAALLRVAMLLLAAGAFTAARANVPAAIVTGTGQAVTLVDGGSTVTLSNGIVSILCTKSGATINQINYTYNNGTTTTTTQLLNGGTDGGMLYWEYGGFGGSSATYSIVVNPATGDSNHPAGDYAEIDLLSTSSTNGTVDIHFSMLRGSPGFYVTAIWSHRSVDAAMGMGETRTNIYAGSMFNWMSVDPGRNKLMAVSTSNTSIPVPGAPVECYLWTSGIYKGLYDDKYKYSADFGDEQYVATPGPHRVWGWSSVGTGGINVGLWDVNASQEYYNCGPMKRELMCHIGTTILNMFNGDHYAEGMDAGYVAGEQWSKVYGPYFVYCNNVPASQTDPYQASQNLYNDAVAQGVAEASGTASTAGATFGATSWPYGWFVNSNYALASGRGTVTGKIVVSDTGNPNASGSNMMVGLVQQPATSAATYDFEAWMKPYGFWTHADANGNFTIPNVIAGANYTLYAFGPGAEGEFMSQTQTGGNPPELYNLPATPFAVTVTGGATTALGNVTWTPTRVGATVFEIGYPDRTARKFRHGDDFWVGDIGPSNTEPAAVWTKYLEFPYDFPNGLTYNVGTSRWSTDWNFVEPVLTSSSFTYNNPTETITFNLASAPTTGGTGSFYIGLASNMSDATIVTLNGSNLGSTTGVTSVPASNNSNGYYSSYDECDSTIREGNNALFTDERLTFPASLLKAGTNTITIQMRQTGGTYFADHIMFDYLRMELTGYVPPPPASVTAYPGSSSMLLSWPVTPGATSYNIGRSTTSGGSFTTIATGILGPVCGSGLNNDAWLDTTATNGTPYYYVVQSVNTTGTSANSTQSTAASPASGTAISAPAAPATLAATASTGQVSLSWAASTGANYYIIQRSVYALNGGAILGGLANSAEDYNLLNTITLTNTATGTSYTDSTPTNGATYTYSVAAVNASGTSTATSSSNAVPLAVAPATAPVLTAAASSGAITLSWSAVPNATGYIIEMATASGGPYTMLTSITAQAYEDSGLSGDTTYYYTVQAVNSGGASALSNIASAVTPPAAPTSLTASPGNTQVTLTWPTSAGATGYTAERGTVTGGPYSIIGTTAGPSYTDTALTNGITYYYVVAASNAGGTGLTSPEANATPNALLPVAPLSLTATATNGKLMASWGTSTGATSYNLFRSTVSGGPYTNIAVVRTNSYLDSGVFSGITYYYVVEAVNSTGASAYSNQAIGSLTGPPAVTWSGSASSAWDYSTLNWVNNSGVAIDYTDNSNVFFDDTAVNGTVALAQAVYPTEVYFTNSVLDYSVNSSSAGISGAAAVTMAGSASVTLTGSESYTGGTTISSGTYAMGADSSESASTVESPGVTGGTVASMGASSSPVLVNGGAQLRFGGVGGATVYTFLIPNAITVDDGNIYGADGLQEFTGGLDIASGGANILPTWSGKNIVIASTLSGTGPVTIDDWEGSGDTSGGLVQVTLPANPYSGTITINAPSTGFLGGDLEISSSTALVNATIIDNNTSKTAISFTGTTAPQIGALGGTGNISLPHNGTLTVGGNGASTTYSGNFSGSGGNLVKTGTGTMILAGTDDHSTGSITVNGGVLELTGTLLSANGLTVGASGVFDLAGGNLSISGNITNNGIFKLSGTPTLTKTGSFTNNGVLDLINGPSTLPTNFVNDGTVLYASSVLVQQAAMSESGFNVTIQSYLQHTYQLQTSPSTSPTAWTNVGAAQAGTGGALILTDPSATTGTQGIYRVLVSP